MSRKHRSLIEAPDAPLDAEQPLVEGSDAEALIETAAEPEPEVAYVPPTGTITMSEASLIKLRKLLAQFFGVGLPGISVGEVSIALQAGKVVFITRLPIDIRICDEQFVDDADFLSKLGGGNVRLCVNKYVSPENA